LGHDPDGGCTIGELNCAAQGDGMYNYGDRIYDYFEIQSIIKDALEMFPGDSYSA